jgi:hypothetical protein
VRVESPEVSDYSPARRFEKQWATSDNAPVLVSPNEGANVDFYNLPVFTWQPVTGAASYKFQIATSETGFNTPVYQQSVITTSHQPASKLQNRDQYFWRVIPLDPGGNEGAASLVGWFQMAFGNGSIYPLQVPSLIQPVNNDLTDLYTDLPMDGRSRGGKIPARIYLCDELQFRCF